jgi:3-oxoadipate enol-lactonase
MTTVQPTGRIETLNAVQIHFEIHGTGQPVLLLHGFSGSSQDWSASVSELRTQFQLIVPDLRGMAAPGSWQNRSGMQTQRWTRLRCSII